MKVRCIVCHREFEIPDALIEVIIMDFEDNVNLNFSCTDCNASKPKTVIEAFINKSILRNANQN